MTAERFWCVLLVSDVSRKHNLCKQLHSRIKTDQLNYILSLMASSGLRQHGRPTELSMKKNILSRGWIFELSLIYYLLGAKSTYKIWPSRFCACFTLARMFH